MLAVPADHGVKMGAKSRVGVLVAKAPNYRAFGSLDRLLHLVRHLQPCDSLHLWGKGGREYVQKFYFVCSKTRLKLEDSV